MPTPGIRRADERLRAGPALAFAAVLDVSWRVEDTCAAIGEPIRVDFVPGG